MTDEFRFTKETELIRRRRARNPVVQYPSMLGTLLKTSDSVTHYAKCETHTHMLKMVSH